MLTTGTPGNTVGQPGPVQGKGQAKKAWLQTVAIYVQQS